MSAFGSDPPPSSGSGSVPRRPPGAGSGAPRDLLMSSTFLAPAFGVVNAPPAETTTQPQAPPAPGPVTAPAPVTQPPAATGSAASGSARASTTETQSATGARGTAGTTSSTQSNAPASAYTTPVVTAKTAAPIAPIPSSAPQASAAPAPTPPPPAQTPASPSVSKFASFIKKSSADVPAVQALATTPSSTVAATVDAPVAAKTPAPATRSAETAARSAMQTPFLNPFKETNSLEDTASFSSLFSGPNSRLATTDPSDPRFVPALFDRMEVSLAEVVQQHFFEDPRRFRSLVDVIAVLGSRVELQQSTGGALSPTSIERELSVQSRNPAIAALFKQRQVVLEVIEEVVKHQHGSLNASVDSLSSVLTDYTRCRDDVKSMRGSIADICDALSARKLGAAAGTSASASLRVLYLKRKELEHRLRIVNAIESLSDAPRKVNQYMQGRCYLNAVKHLTGALASAFTEDLIGIDGVSGAQQELMQQKERVLECIVDEFKNVLLGMNSDMDAGSVAFRSQFGFEGGESLAAGQDRSSVAKAVASKRSVVSSVVGNTASVASVSNSSNIYEWSYELSGLDETFERSLGDPHASGTVFLRLLVLAAAELGCQDDVERMLLDDAPRKVLSTLREIKAATRATSSDFPVMASYENQQATFSTYLHKLLDTIYVTTKKLMYCLRLLRISKTYKQDKMGQLYVGDNTKRAMLQIISSASRVLQHELELHLVEPEVVQMSDVVEPRSRNRRESAGVASRSLLGGAQDAEESSADIIALDSATVCQPSVTLVAPVYQDIIAFSKRINKLLKEECNMEDNDIPKSQIVSTVERISQSDLLPLIQSHINQAMNDIQNNPALFAPTKIDGGMNDSTVHGASAIDGGHGGVQTRVASYNIVCAAATRCFNTIRPLLTYWLQLPQHGEAVVTILDRIIRGFASFAKQEVEGLSWKMYASDDKWKKAVMENMRVDAVFLEYRRSVYGDNCTTLEELLGLADPATASASASGSAVSASASRSKLTLNIGKEGSTISRLSGSEGSDSLFPNLSAAESEMWGPLWELNAPQYITTNELIGKDMGSLGTMASIALGCDWLTREIARACVAVSKQRKVSMKAKAPTGSYRGASVQRGGVLGLGGASLEDVSAVAKLVNTVQLACKELSRVSEETLAILRGDAQVATFHFLHHLANMKFGRANVVSSVITGGIGTGGSSVASGSAFGIGKGGAGSGGAAVSIASSNAASTKESDNVIYSFNKQLIFLQDALSSATIPEAFAVIVSAACVLAPRVLMRSIRYLLPPVTPDGFGRLMRSVIACHQSMSMLLESSALDPAMGRALQDRVTEGFDKVRRYAAFLGGTAKDLESFMGSSPREYTKDEYAAIWSILKDGSKYASFNDLWSSLSTNDRPLAGNVTDI